MDGGAAGPAEVAVEEFRNFTDGLGKAEAFIRAKCEQFATGGLSIHLKHTRAKDRDFDGYYRLDDSRLVVAVKQGLRYPRRAAYGVGSTSRQDWDGTGLPYHLVWHEDEFGSADDLAVFGAGHELWHFLCHTGQRRRDHETRANCNGFLWLAEFKDWPGPGAPVSAQPALPPRPDGDRPDGSSQDGPAWVQLGLFGAGPGSEQRV